MGNLPEWQNSETLRQTPVSITVPLTARFGDSGPDKGSKICVLLLLLVWGRHISCFEVPVGNPRCWEKIPCAGITQLISGCLIPSETSVSSKFSISQGFGQNFVQPGTEVAQDGPAWGKTHFPRS